jgi:choline-sulfatase
MLGERGLWYKMNFFEHAARVPMIVHAPKVLAPRRIAENVSLMDLLPTFCEIATDGKGVEYAAPVDGSSVLDLAAGSSTGRSNTVFGEYMAEGTFQPAFMIRRGRWKYISCVGDPDQLYDVSADPSEIRNLAADPKHNQVARSFAGEVAAKWDSTAIRAKVVESQRNRVLIQDALLKGKITPWDFQPFQDAAKQYNRNYGAELYDTDRRARIPFRPEPERDGKGAK